MTTLQILTLWNFDPTILGGSAALLVAYAAAVRFRFTRAAIYFALGVLAVWLALVSEGSRMAFRAALENDLDTPQAIAVLDGLANDILNGKYTSGEKAAAQASLVDLAGILGLRLGNPIDERVTLAWDRHRQKFT